MKLFNSVIKIMTDKEDILPKAVYLENLIWTQWTYYIYYYDIDNHSIYINDLNYIWTKDRTSVTNIVEHIATKIYKQEIKHSSKIKEIHKNDKPKIFNIYINATQNLIIDKVDLWVLRDDNWEITSFRIPTRNISNNNVMKLEEIRKELSKFYQQQPHY